MGVEARVTGIEALSERQKEILRLMARHLQAKEVALILKISRHTVDTHTEEARRRLGVATSREAARLLSDYENSLPNDQGHPSSGMAGEASGMALSGHENAQTERIADDERGYGHPVAGPRIGLAHAGDAGEAIADRRYPDGGQGAEPGRPYQGGLHHGGGDGLADGRQRGLSEGGLGDRLKALSPLQCLGLAIALSVAMAFLFVALLSGAAAMIDVLVTLTGRKD